MKVLISKGRGKGNIETFTTTLTPIHNDWLAWKTLNKTLKIIHEKCYFKFIVDPRENAGGLNHIKEEKIICAMCGLEPPESVQKFILLVNGVQNYDRDAKL